jgi:hypothetical protein
MGLAQNKVKSFFFVTWEKKTNKNKKRDYTLIANTPSTSA